MAIAQANKDRDRRYINGRVLGWTNSAYIEFLDKNLNYSYPLFFNNGGYSGGDKEGVSFNLELPEGYLTFDENSVVKLVETDSYKRTDVNAMSFFRATAADPFEPTINAVNGIYDRVADNYHSFYVAFYTKPYNNGEYKELLFEFSPPVSANDFGNFIANHPTSPKVGETYKGKGGYPGFTFKG